MPLALAALLPLIAAGCGERSASAPAAPAATTIGVVGAAGTTTTVVSVSTTSPRVSTTSNATTPRATTTSGETTTSTSSTTTSSTTTTEPVPTTTIHPDDVRRGYPIDVEIHTSFTPEAHANYRAADIFATTNCGTPLLSPVDGVIDEVQHDAYDRATDDPALRGGNAVSIIGDDGVRYYLAHFETFEPTTVTDARVEVGALLGTMGTTGRSGACHLHFGLSLPCPDHGDWWIRRGVIWPDRYLDAWKSGENLSPLDELQEWFAEHPDACRSWEDTPYRHG